MIRIKRSALIITAVLTIFIFTLTAVSCIARNKSKFKKIMVMWWGTQNRHEKTLKVIDMYMAKNVTVTIEPVYTSWDEYWEKLSVMEKTGKTPDVLNMTIQNLAKYQNNGLLADFDGLPELDQTKMDNSALESGKVNGKLYGICLGAYAYGLIYNKEYFDKAQISYPTEKTTWDDIRNISLGFKKKLNILGLDTMKDDNFDFFVRSKGESLFSKEAKDIGFKKETAFDFFKMIYEYQKDAVMVPLREQSKSSEDISFFGKGKCAMFFRWSNNVIGTYKILNKILGLATFPGHGNEQAVYLNPEMFFCISAGSKNKNQAAHFINWFIADPQANKILDAERGVPAVADVRNELLKNKDEQTRNIYQYIDFVGRYSKRPVDTIFPEKERDCYRALRDIMELVYYDKIKPDEAAEQLIIEWKRLLKE